MIQNKFLRPDGSDKVFEVVKEQEKEFHFNANNSLSLNEQRERLPIKKYRDQILYCIENYQTTIICGETGCGKSTQIPQYLYEYGWHLKGVIGITEPRKISAISLAERVANELGQLIGNEVGVSARFIEHTSNETKIKYMTEGILLREMLSDPLLSKYAVICVDEAHERTVLSDIVLGLLKKIIRKRISLKLIVTSATIDSDFFKDFFSIKRKGAKEPSSIVLTVEGKMHPTSIFYMNQPCADYVKESVETVIKIHENEPPGGVLVFLTGQEEVLECMQLLNEFKTMKELENIQIFPLYSAMPQRDQLKAFFTPPKGVRKIILATNIAETSVTIPGITYVVDCGFVKMKWFNSITSSDNLVVLPISKASATQRAGRAGRIGPGKVYRLFTEKDFQNLPDRVPPEMRRSELSAVILHLKALGISNILRFDFPYQPPSKNVLAALSTLSALEAIDETGSLTKPVGYFLAEMPLEPVLSKMIFLSVKMECFSEILTIVAMLQVQSIYSNPVSAQGRVKQKVARRLFESEEGDLITLLNVYTGFINNGQSKEFCGRYYLIYRNLKRAVEIRDQLLSLCKKLLHVTINQRKSDVNTICKCITAGLIQNLAYLHHSGVYRKIQCDTELFVHPQSILYALPQHQYLVYCELMQTTKLLMSNLTVTKEEWFTELAPHLYQKTTSNYA